MENNWELSFGIFNGLLFGFRTYPDDNKIDYVLYLGIFDVCYTINN
jgi:hypothetical protein